MKMLKLEMFLQGLISQVMQKQDQMHKQVMEIVERREQERIISEEARKKQESERAKVDEEERVRETLRSMALISFIQNLSYDNIEVPSSSESSYRGKDCIGIENHGCVKDESSNRRWPRTEVQALITVRVAIEHKLLVKGTQGSGWKEVAAGLCNLGYNRTPEKCREKWENINKYYKRTMESGKKRRKSLPYFEELDMIYKRSLVTQGKAAES